MTSNKVRQIIDFFIYHIPFLLFFFLSKLAYSDAVLAYLALYPSFYLVYTVESAVKETDNNEIRNFVVAQTSLVPILHTAWLSHVFRRAEWWKDLFWWIVYFGITATLFLSTVYVFKWTPKVDCRKAVDALVPLAVFHPIYAVAAMFSTATAGVDVYRILLWYFAVYPAALAAAVLVAGGRPRWPQWPYT